MLFTDIATWVGPTGSRNVNAMASPPRGLVLHIASGFYDGTISWQKRSSGSDRTSSHFIVARDGRCAQMVDTADGSWAQRAGNNTWLSVELEGFAPDDGLHATHPGWETATPQQVEVCAQLLARAHREFGVPLQLATSPSGRGLGHHSMGAESGVDWGHSQCPGMAIKSQKAAILARAIAITNGQGDDVPLASEVLGKQTISPDHAAAPRNGNEALSDLYVLRLVLIGQLTLAEAGFGPTSPLAKLLALADAGPQRPPTAEALAAALKPLLADLNIEVGEAELVAALQSEAGQAALTAAANRAEDS